MRVLLIMDPGIPVPPQLYGGIERVVFLLAREYVSQGHEVTLLAGPGSYCEGQTITFGENDMNRSSWQKNKEVAFVWRFLNRHSFNLIHNFGRLIYLLPVLNKPVKKIMSYQRRVTQKGIRIINMLPNKQLVFTACSNSCVSTGNIAGKWVTVYNAIDFSQYDPSESVDENAPLMFLGRLDQIKGAHSAIKVAKATNNTLVLAGNIPDTPDNFDYYKATIEPQIDNKQIKYAGALNDVEKNSYLRQAKALLFPIEWDEPFGIVMIEAMACGTPVIAFNRGSVPEVVSEETGMIVTNVDEMINAVENLGNFNRLQCYEESYKRFNINKIAREYLNL